MYKYIYIYIYITYITITINPRYPYQLTEVQLKLERDLTRTMIRDRDAWQCGSNLEICYKRSITMREALMQKLVGKLSARVGVVCSVGVWSEVSLPLCVRIVSM